MSSGDPDFDGKEKMEIDEEHEGGAQDLMDTDEEYIKDEEHSNTNPPTTETEDSKVPEVTNEETEKLQKQLHLKCKVETNSTKTKSRNKDYEEEEDKDEVEADTDNGVDSSIYPLTQAQSQTRETVSPNEVDDTAFSSNTKMDDSLEKGNQKNPMLLSPVIRCVLKFLNIEDIKHCRRVCRDWGAIGKPLLASRALISFHNLRHKGAGRFPVEFQSCFGDSTSYFSAFDISGILRNDSKNHSWTIKELRKFLNKQQKYIKELTLNFQYPNENLVKKINLNSWISKSPMVEKEAKYLTKLTIEGNKNNLDIRPLHLIAHIKDLSLLNCKIHVETGIKINPVTLKLSNAEFYQDGARLSSVQINNIVELGRTKEITLHIWNCDSKEYVLDLCGRVTLKKLLLYGDNVKIVNGETSQWAIEHLAIMNANPYILNRQMNIKELYLHSAGSLDLFNISTSIQYLVVPPVSGLLNCSQPIALQNLQYLQIVDSLTDLSFLSHFMNCPQLTHLKLYGCNNMELKSLWMPKTIKTLTIQGCDSQITWDCENFWNFETLVLVVDSFRDAKQICETKIRVDDFIVNTPCPKYYDMVMDKSLVDFLEHRKRYNFGRRLFIGELHFWDDRQFENSLLFDHVEGQSSFYVFQDGQKGHAVSKRDFHQLIPKHIDVGRHFGFHSDIF